MEALLRSPYYVGLLAILFVAEWVWRTRYAQRGYDLKAGAASAGIAAGNLLLAPLVAGAMAALSFLMWDLAPVHLPLDDWRVWAVCFVLVEFVYYWWHRWSHEVRWLWATHAVHHTPTELTLPASFRIGWTGLISGGWMLFTLIILIGFHPIMVTTLWALGQAYQVLLHTDAVGKLWRPIEYVFNTPSHHRAHHACNGRYIDKNYGGVFIVFDRWFGSFVEESNEEPLRYGLAHPVNTNNPVTIVFHEWGRMAKDLRSVRSVRQAGQALFGRPA